METPFATENSRFCGIIADGRQVGEVGFSDYGDSLGIGSLSIYPELRGQGYGTAAIKAIIDKFGDDYDTIYCYVDDDNEEALKLYRKLGYVSDETNNDGQHYVEFQGSLLSEDLKDAAKDLFGLTETPELAFYVNTDGTLLDGSGRKLGNARSYHRAVDHRDIGFVMDDVDGTEAMLEYMREGNIRWIPEAPGFEIMEEPTEAQYRTLSKIIYCFSAGFSVDIDNERGDVIRSFSYDRPSRKVISDIRKTFAGELTEAIRPMDARTRAKVDAIVAKFKQAGFSKLPFGEIQLTISDSFRSMGSYSYFEYSDRHELMLSKYLLQEDDDAIDNTIAHELCHFAAGYITRKRPFNSYDAEGPDCNDLHAFNPQLFPKAHTYCFPVHKVGSNNLADIANHGTGDIIALYGKTSGTGKWGEPIVSNGAEFKTVFDKKAAEGDFGKNNVNLRINAAFIVDVREEQGHNSLWKYISKHMTAALALKSPIERYGSYENANLLPKGYLKLFCPECHRSGYISKRSNLGKTILSFCNSHREDMLKKIMPCAKCGGSLRIINDDGLILAEELDEDYKYVYDSIYV